MVNNVETKLNSRQGLLMQGFPENFIFPVSENQAMKQLGNSVAVSAIQATAKNISQALKDKKHFNKVLNSKNGKDTLTNFLCTQLFLQTL